MGRSYSSDSIPSWGTSTGVAKKKGKEQKRQSDTHSSQEEGACHALQGHMEKNQGQLGGRRTAGGGEWARVFIVLFAGRNG